MKPFFSVIIPVFNRADEIRSSIESVLRQSFEDFEIIVVDDGSTDETAAVAGSFTDPRIKYIFQENKERSAARNNGIKNASGEYICFLDSDDIFYPEHLAALHEAIVADGMQKALYKTMMHYANGRRPTDFSNAFKGKNKEAAIKYVWTYGSQMDCLCVHASICNEVLFPEKYFWFEDIHWVVRVVLKYPLRQIRAYTTYYNNKSSANILRSNFQKYVDNCEACIRDLEVLHGNELKRILGKKCFDRKVAELYLGFVVANAIENRQFGIAREYLLKAAKVCTTRDLSIKYVFYTLKLLGASIWKG
jgi:glycosyltransferase involved in cell wall biosynthesis